MRVVYVNPSGCLGGAERVLLSILAAVGQADPPAESHLIACGDGPLVDRARRQGTPVTVLPLPDELAALGDSQLALRGAVQGCWLLADAARAVPALWRYACRLRKVVRGLAPSLVHSNGIKAHLLLALAPPGRTPVLWHGHDFYGSRRLAGRLLRGARRRAAGAVAVSDAVARDLRTVLPGLPVETVPNTVDLHAFSPAAGDGAWLDRLAGLPPAPAGSVRVGLVATYARWKGQAEFLQAGARLLQAAPASPVRFYVVGGPVYRTRGSEWSETELRGLACRLGLGDRAGFIAFQPEPANVYRALDVVVHASTRPEPFGLTILEAMACGRAVVAAPAGGAAELFCDGHDALGCPGGNVPALARALRQLIEDPGCRARLGANARRTATERFGSGRLAEQFLRLYDRLLRGSLGASEGGRRPSSDWARRGPARAGIAPGVR